MTTARGWRTARAIHGPYRIETDDIAPLNDVFSDAFTERYRRDGLVGVRVPYLNPVIWRYAIEDAGDGAMLWRGERNEIVAFNIAHMSGMEGWMGPLAVRPDAQGTGIGKTVVRAGVEWLTAHGARVIGLETMPRTMDNIGFYSMLDFVPGRLTITVTLDAVGQQRPARLLGRLSSPERDATMAAMRALTERVQPGYDFTREVELTESLSLGDTVLLDRGGELTGFALCHTAPLVEGRTREETRVLKMVLEDDRDTEAMMALVTDFARRSGTRRASLRVQGEYLRMYRRLIAAGGRVRWTDLRMTVATHPEGVPRTGGVVLSNWEI